MKRKNRIFFCLLAVFLLVSMSLTAFAHDAVDMGRLCSVTITIHKGQTPIPGGSLTIYRVCEVVEDDGSYFFRPTEAFTACGEDFSKLDAAADLAHRLEAYIEDPAISGLSTREIGEDGTVSFTELPVGLYLFVQHEAAPGYEALAPFLVSLPYMEDGIYRYDLKADPKPDLNRAPVATEPPAPTIPPDQWLPNTGQLWWPVPVLACGGLAMFCIGLALTRRRKPDEE